MPNTPKMHDWRSGEPFVPSDEQMALWPEISGNAINGLGENAMRRPTPVYWHHRSLIPHGQAMMWMLKRLLDAVPQVRDLTARFGGRGTSEPAPVASVAESDSPESWATRVKAAALEH